MRILKYVFSIFKIIYITLGYYLVGLGDDEYYYSKGNFWAEVGNYQRAIKNYKKVLQERDDSDVEALIGWCYAAIGMSGLALKHYRNAYEKDKQPKIAIGLASCEFTSGNLEESKRVLSRLKESGLKLDAIDLESLKNIEILIQEKERGDHTTNYGCGKVIGDD